ncbi:MAG: Spore germination protein B3 precursor [Firmicutes bacterium ADurb.Bin182]|nr:MAG: Spore germination protein B3 precursor [Firmicutes bacterium ADurb.Bin182]
MMRKILAVILAVSICSLSCACMDYTGLNQMNIIIGVAIDKDVLTGEYILTYETVDITAIAKKETKSALIESRGESIFDAARNAKLKLINKLYFGNIESLIVSHQIAEEENGLSKVTDLFLRGTEVRETINIIISQEKTAAEILKAKPINTSFISTEAADIISEDAETTAKSYNIQLYNAYNTTLAEGQELVIPVISCTVNNEEPAVQTNGVAVFKDERLKGYLSPDETKYFLFVMDEIKGGLLVFKTKEDVSVTMEVYRSSTKRSYTYENGRFKYTIEPKTKVFVTELSDRVNMINVAVKERVIADAEEFLSNNISAVVRKAQTVFRSDIFGFGGMINKKEPKLWRTISKDWDDYFRKIEIEVKPKIEIMNTGFLKH